jgi:hypothetical protein
MKYTVVKSIIRLIGYGWYDQLQCQELTIDSSELMDIEEKIEQKGDVKEGIKEWLEYNAGDFSETTDFMADLEFSSGNVIADWNDPVNERVFHDIQFGWVGDNSCID